MVLLHKHKTWRRIEGTVEILEAAISKKKSHGNSPKKELLKRHAEYFESAKKQAWDRFDLDPLPIGIPEEHEPPQTHSFEWENMPVSLKVEQKEVSKDSCKKG